MEQVFAMCYINRFLLKFSELKAASVDKQEDKYLSTYVKSNDSDECDQEYSCTGCSSVRICRKEFSGTLNKVKDFNCPNSNPFCDPESGTCAKAPSDVTCNPISYNFTCPSDGYFPDPLDCKKYYACVKGVAYSGDCGLSYYNAKSENCQYTYLCHTINCQGKSGIKVAYSNQKAFFGYCYNNSLIAFDKCPGKFELDESKQKCVPVCYTEGYQGDPNDCSKYYKCYYQTSPVILTLSHFKCPAGELFDALNLRCVQKKEGLTCTSGQVYSGTENFLI